MFQRPAIRGPVTSYLADNVRYDCCMFQEFSDDENKNKWLTLTLVCSEGQVFFDEHYLLQPQPFRLVKGTLNGTDALTIMANLGNLNDIIQNLNYVVNLIN